MLGKEIGYFVKLLASVIVSVFVLEILVCNIIQLLICVSVSVMSEYLKNLILGYFYSNLCR